MWCRMGILRILDLMLGSERLEIFISGCLRQSSLLWEALLFVLRTEPLAEDFKLELGRIFLIKGE
jgi:hypothetical protein